MPIYSEKCPAQYLKVQADVLNILFCLSKNKDIQFNRIISGEKLEISIFERLKTGWESELLVIYEANMA